VRPRHPPRGRHHARPHGAARRAARPHRRPPPARRLGRPPEAQPDGSHEGVPRHVAGCGLRVVLKLYASLTDYLPQQGRDQRHAIDVDVPAETTIDAMIERFHLPRRSVHLVLVNGVYVAPALRTSRKLADGDHLAIWPPVAGG